MEMNLMEYVESGGYLVLTVGNLAVKVLSM